MRTQRRPIGLLLDSDREVFIRELRERLAKRGIRVSKRAISGVATWNHASLRRFAQSHEMTLQDLLELIDLVYTMFFFPHGVRWRRSLPPLTGATPGQRLREIRQQRRILLENFAHRARLGLENLCRYENDRRSLVNAELRTVLALAIALECPLVEVYEQILGVSV